MKYPNIPQVMRRVLPVAMSIAAIATPYIVYADAMEYVDEALDSITNTMKNKGIPALAYCMLGGAAYTGVRGNAIFSVGLAGAGVALLMFFSGKVG